MTSQTSIFEFSQFREYLKYRIDLQLRGTSGIKRSNLSRVAKGIGYRSPSLLSMVLKGRRIPSSDFVEALADGWKLKPSEREHLKLLALLERGKARGKDVSNVLKKLERSSKGKAAHKFSLSQFEVIRDWYCLVIKEMIAAKGFVEDPVWISRRLRRKVSPAQVQAAIEALTALGLVQRNSETGQLEIRVGYTETTDDVPSAAIRSGHRGMLERAIESIEEQDPADRFLNALTLRMDPARIPEAKDALVQFVRNFNTEYGSSESDRVYQLNVQLFEHTRADVRGISPVAPQETDHASE